MWSFGLGGGQGDHHVGAAAVHVKGQLPSSVGKMGGVGMSDTNLDMLMTLNAYN